MNQTPVAPPKLRGWFHLGATPAVIIASLVLFILSKSSLKFAVAIYSITAIMLFSVSAIYHRVPWVPEKKKIWRRWDHANINLLIAGSYTPFAVALLEGRDRVILLSVVWIGAATGVALRVFWIRCTPLAICRQLPGTRMGCCFLHASPIPRGWFMGATANRDRWFVLFGWRDFLRPQASWPRGEVFRLPRAFPYLRAGSVDQSVRGNLGGDLQ